MGHHIVIAEEALLLDPNKEMAVLAVQLAIPSVARDQMGYLIDASCIDQWRELLDAIELQALAGFVRANIREIDKIISGRGIPCGCLSCPVGVESPMDLRRTI